MLSILNIATCHFSMHSSLHTEVLSLWHWLLTFHSTATQVLLLPKLWFAAFHFVLLTSSSLTAWCESKSPLFLCNSFLFWLIAFIFIDPQAIACPLFMHTLLYPLEWRNLTPKGSTQRNMATIHPLQSILSIHWNSSLWYLGLPATWSASASKGVHRWT